MIRRTAPLLLVLLLAGCMSYASEPAGSIKGFQAYLRGGFEAAPTDSPGEAFLEAVYSTPTRILKWNLRFSKLSGPITFAFIQGPDGVGNARADIVPINLAIEGGPKPGGTTLTAQQEQDLLAGRWFVNLKTEQFPAGEIGGPLLPMKK